MNTSNLTIVIPTYNEGDIIESSLRRVSDALGKARSGIEIIIADDGSDDLPEVVRVAAPSFGFGTVRVMRNPTPLGKGASIARAFESSRSPIVCFIDVDHSVAPTYIHDAWREIQSGNDICIGSRVGNRWKSDKSVLTSIMAAIFNFTHRTLIFGRGRSFRDTQCGFKFFRREVAVDLYTDLVATDGLNDLEVLLRAVKKGHKISELEVPRTNDRVGKIRVSTILTRESISLWKIFLKYRLGI